MNRMLLFLVLASVCTPGAAAHAQTSRVDPGLTVVQTAPTGEVATMAEANEIRIVFSEPMVTLGRIPARVQPGFIKTKPAVAGTFRWSGTTILILTPDPKRPLAHSTTYQVTIAGAVAASGRKLAQPVTFAFTTSTVRLLKTEWYRRGNRFDGHPVIALRFNQRVKPADVLRHLSARFAPHPWKLDDLEPLRARLRASPQELARLNSKVDATRAAAAATAPVSLVLTTDWDRKRIAPGADLVVVEAAGVVPPESWFTIALDAQLPSPAGPSTPGKVQDYTIKVEPAFFIEAFQCSKACDPDDANPLKMRASVAIADFAKAASVKDVSVTVREVGVARPHPAREKDAYGNKYDVSATPTLEDAGFDTQPPAHTYAVTVDAGLRSTDGQTLGYAWIGTVENWHRRAFTSFGDGHGVWELGGGSLLPFYARNFRNATEWAAPVPPRELMPTLRRLQDQNFSLRPPGAGTPRPFNVTADRIQSHGLDISNGLGSKPTGLVWAAVQPGATIAQTKVSGGRGARASLIQVTNLGVTVKDSPHNTLIFVTRLDTGAPVAGAAVSIVRLDNSVFWTGVTGEDGIAMAPDTALRDREAWWKFAFIVMAEKDADVAYVGSDWNEGVQPWDFETRFDLGESPALLRGSVFTDRGVYRLGEEIHFKAVLRENGASGIRLLPAGTSVLISVRDSQDRIVDDRTIKMNAWSSAEWTLVLPEEGTLGDYSVRAILESDRPKPRTPESLKPGERPSPQNDDDVPYVRRVSGSFLVAAYRRPDFRVDVSLAGATARPDALVAGAPLNGTVAARYLFGAPMQTRPVKWTLTRSPLWDAPAPVREKFPQERWEFVGYRDDEERGTVGVAGQETTLTKAGTLPLKLSTAASDGLPWEYSLEGDVEDVSRQHIANRAAAAVHPANWYVGIRRLPYFTEQKNGIKTEIVAVGLDGATVAGVPVELKLTQIQWRSVRRAEGGGFYTWDTEKKEIPIGAWTVTTGEQPVPFETTLPSGGNFVLIATGRGEAGRFAMTRTSFFALGDGYTAWARYDHNRISLVPERKTWKPGENARIMIQSPWEQATALVTTEREGVRTYKQFALTSTQQSVSLPMTEADIPNVFVSVLLVKGRTKVTAAPGAQGTAGAEEADGSDPGKPAFRLGYVELKVEDAAKRLTVAVKANKEEYRPANAATLDVDVKDRQGRGATSEVTLWAVDYGVLSLTAYRTPDVLKSVYVEKALQVMNIDSRQRIVSRRVLTPKGSTDGGGGGRDGGAGTLRKDFRVLAFWLGSVTTDSSGHASVDVKLPESLTTYRIMAVAGGSRVKVRLRRERGPHQQAGHAEARLSTFPRGRRHGALRGCRDQPAAIRRHSGRDDEEPGPGCASAHRCERAVRSHWRRRFSRGAVPGGRPVDWACACSDDGHGWRRKRRLRRYRPRRSARLTGNRGGVRRGDGCGRNRARDADGSDRNRPGVRGTSRRAGVHGDGRPRRRCALPRGVPLRMRRAEGITRAGAAACGRSGRRIHAARDGYGEDAPRRAADTQGARNISMRQRRVCLLAGPVLVNVSVSDRIPVARLPGGGGSQIPGGSRDARACVRLSGDGTGQGASAERGVVARLHGMAGVCGQSARGGRTESGLQHQPVVRLPRPDAGVCPCVSARCAARKRRVLGCAHDRSQATHVERRAARSRQRARRGAQRSVSALVLEFEHTVNCDCVEQPGARRCRRHRAAAAGPLVDGREEGRALGQHAGERLRHGGARRLLQEV